MKKFVILVLMAASLSSCTFFRKSADWADNTFFGGDPNPNQPTNNYPYYYGAASAPNNAALAGTSAIDANEDKSAYRGGVIPPVAPYSQAPQQPQYAQPQQPAAPLPAYGGYGVQQNTPSPTTSVSYGDKGVKASTAKPAAVQAPAQTQQQVAPQYYPPQQPQYQQPYYAPAPAQQPVQNPQGLTYEQYQQMYYGQTPAVAPYQYPPAK